MGITHYWYMPTPIHTESWRLIKLDSLKLIDAFPEKHMLCMSVEAPTRAPYVNDDLILFNGRGKRGAEDFQLFRTPYKPRFWCKAYGLPYENLVCAVLAVAHAKWPDIRIQSDRNVGFWTPHTEWASVVLQRPVLVPKFADPKTFLEPPQG